MTGRFAPTPSGPLHMGSLVTAVASYCHAKSQHQKWLLRIEDLDTPRIVKGSADDILRTLDTFGFEWNGDVVYQSQRFEAYEQVIQQLLQKKLVYACECSRKQLMANEHATGPLGLIYPGACRTKHLNRLNFSLRLNVDQAGKIKFMDAHYGRYELNISTDVGDIVLKRIDGIYAYHLAVVIDDAYQGVKEIVRGADLLEVTCVHLYLNSLLRLPNASYLHIPLIRNPDGKKLSKQTGAMGLDNIRPSEQLHQALLFLGQDMPEDFRYLKPAELLQYAIANWDSDRIPHQC